MAPSGTVTFFVYYVYGGYEHPKCDCSRIHTVVLVGIGLPLEVISWGSMLSLSEKDADDKGMVDHSDPGCFSDCDAA